MSDFEESGLDGEDFSASEEDEWKPGKYDGSDSSGDDSDFDEKIYVNVASTSKNKRNSNSKSMCVKNNMEVPKSRKRSLQSLRSKMHKKYSPRPKISPISINKRLTEQLQSSKYKKRKILSSSRSESSGSYAMNNEPQNSGSNIKSPQLSDSDSDYDYDENVTTTYNKTDNKIAISSVQQNINDEDDVELEDVSMSEEARAYGNKIFQKLHESNEDMRRTKEKLMAFTLKNSTDETEDLDVAQILAMGEEMPPSKVPKLTNRIKTDDESETDWEEVKDVTIQSVHKNPQKDIQIVVRLSDEEKRKKRENEELMAEIRRRINRSIRENQLNVHKVSLLCQIGYGIYVNKVLTDPTLMKLALSLLPNKTCYPSGRTNLEYFESFVKWYRQTISSKFKTTFDHSEFPSLLMLLSFQMKRKMAYSERDFILIFIIILRAMGISCRFVLNAVTPPIRPAHKDLYFSKPKKSDVKNPEKSLSEKGNKSKIKGKSGTRNEDKFDEKDEIKEEKMEDDVKSVKNKKEKGKGKDGNKKNKNGREEPETTKKEEHVAVVKRRTERLKNKATKKKDETEVEKTESDKKSGKQNKKENVEKKDEMITDQTDKIKRSSRLKSLSISKVPQLDGGDSEVPLTRSRKSNNQKNLKNEKGGQKSVPFTFKIKVEDLLVSSKKRSDQKNQNNKRALSTDKDEVATNSKKKPKIENQEKVSRRSQVKDKKVNLKKLESPPEDIEKASVSGNKEKMINLKKLKEPKGKEKRHSISEEEFLPSAPAKFKKVRAKFLDHVKKVDRRVLSTDDDDVLEDNKKEVIKNEKRSTLDYWAEVFLEEEERWIPIDVINCKLHSIESIRKTATQPISYVFAWNNDGSIKDVSERYCPRWNITVRKFRLDQEWLNETLKSFVGKKTPRDIMEDKEFEKMHLDKPMPTTITEFKNHPLYALKRHLLKFEVIYPPDAMTLGFIRGEPIYSRDCVHLCHSRDVWLKAAKVVKPGEEPYKIVKSRPKWDRLTGSVIKDLPLEIFGYWQTMPYEPPTAENGLVPRNAYGNVELFRKCMLPKKTVHLQLQGLNRICKKLGIDCAPAVIGFDFNQGSSHPVFDGFVVCEEFADQVIEAWEKDKEETERKEKEKRLKRIYENWKTLIRGVKIRKRLKDMYNV